MDFNVTGERPQENIQSSQAFQSKPKLDSKGVSKITKIGASFLQGFSFIAKGAEKVVLRMIDANKLNELELNNGGKSYVFYVPFMKGIISKVKALKEEFAKITEIKSKISSNELTGANLALDVTEAKSETIGLGKGQYVLKVEAAKCDFKKEITPKATLAEKPSGQTPSIDMKQRFSYAKDFVNGLNDLHKVGYAYGDMKPENCLIYENEQTKEKTLKISDFGKTQDMSKYEDGTCMYKGNLRFAPPEGKMSQKGDVYSAGLVLIRLFEEQYLADGSIMEVEKKDKEVNAQKNRRGIEKCIVEHKAFPGLDEPTLFDKIFRRLPRQATLTRQSDDKKEAQNNFLNEYIDTLGQRMFKDMSGSLPGASSSKEREKFVNNLTSLLKNMVVVNPNDRLTMEDVQKNLKEVMEQLPGKQN